MKLFLLVGWMASFVPLGACCVTVALKLGVHGAGAAWLVGLLVVNMLCFALAYERVPNKKEGMRE